MSYENDLVVYKFIGKISLVIISLLIFSSPALKVYNVWSEGKAGEAELARAHANRSIKILEARASEESAKHLASAEVARARGVAEANKIIGDSLKNNESYLRYLWITGLQTPNKEIVYVPTEANIPIMEAGRSTK